MFLAVGGKIDGEKNLIEICLFRSTFRFMFAVYTLLRSCEYSLVFIFLYSRKFDLFFLLAEWLSTSTEKKLDWDR